MSLRVWLPLTKDLRNQGLDSVTITNNGATFNSDGKLGGCYSFDRSTPTYLKVNNPLTTAENGVSIAFWVKLPSNASGNNQIVHIGNGPGWNNNRYTIFVRSGASYLIFSLSGGSNATSTQYTLVSSNLTLDVWTYVVCTYNTGKAKIYLNGILDHEYTISITPSFDNTPYIGIGAAPNAAEGVTCSLNDVRIYDHCLSQMEVKELSKGLVLHYPLNRQGWGQENLITQTMIDTEPWKSAISGSYIIDGKTGWILSNSQLYSKSGNGANNIFSGLTYEANTQYTISFKWRDDYRTDGKSSSLYIRFKYSDGTYSQVISSKDYNYWKEEVMTSTAGKTVSAITTTYGNGGNLLFTDLKLEKGTIKTPTSPIVNSDLYNSMNLNSTTEYDCSGYCNNGTRTGTFGWTSDTPKYNVSQYFNGSSYILTDSGTFSWFDFSECTIAVWMKPTTTPSSWAGTFGIAHNNSSSNKSFVIGNYGGKFTVQSANGGWVNIQSSALPINEWHHCVATLDGTTIKMYFDGELVNTYTTSWGSTTVASDTRVQVGNDLPGSDEIYQGYYSDARIYATALSAEDVLDLYNNTYTVN